MSVITIFLDRWEVVVQGPLGSGRARPVGKWSCKAHWEVVVQGPLGSGRARPRADRKKSVLSSKKNFLNLSCHLSFSLQFSKKIKSVKIIFKNF